MKGTKLQVIITIIILLAIMVVGSFFVVATFSGNAARMKLGITKEDLMAVEGKQHIIVPLVDVNADSVKVRIKYVEQLEPAEAQEVRAAPWYSYINLLIP